MKIYASVANPHIPLREVGAHARRAEKLGYDGLVVPEVVNDAMMVSLLALEHTERLRVITGIVVAFARSPMLLAQQAWALQGMSNGRFELGLGTQVKGNIEKRFGMPWSAPVPRMRDYVGALRAIFDCWQNGTPLRYESPNYTITRMQPFFKPGPLDRPDIPIILGAVQPRAIRLAGEVADAVIAHPTNSSPEYLRDVMRPKLAEGARKAGRQPESVRVIANPLIATGPDRATVEAEREAAREVLAFTYSTPAYWATLEHHGWDIGPKLLEKTRQGDWPGMKGVITEAILDVLVPAATFEGISELVRRRYGGLADGVCLRMPADPMRDEAFREVVESLRA
jgi:probable F420-dependent oxidoreductase